MARRESSRLLLTRLGCDCRRAFAAASGAPTYLVVERSPALTGPRVRAAGLYAVHLTNTGDFKVKPVAAGTL